MVFVPRKRRCVRWIIVAVLVCSGVSLLMTVFPLWNLDLYVKDTGRKLRSYGIAVVVGLERKPRNRDGLDISKASVRLRQGESNPTSQSTTFSQHLKRINRTWIHHPWTPSLRGHLNVHIWLDWCGSTVNDLRRHIHFPHFPDVRVKTRLFHLVHDAHNYGQRVFGYLHPPRTGFYVFAISSDDSSELWLSSGESPRRVQLIAWVGNLTDAIWGSATSDRQFTKYKSQISAKIFLAQGGHYFVEALHKQSTSDDHLLVAWKIPEHEYFSYITSGRISEYIHPHMQRKLDIIQYSHHIPLTPATLKPAIDPQLQLEYRTPTKDPVTSNINLESKSVAAAIYPKCSYSPSYLVDFNLTRYQGVYLVHETAVYPDDKTDLRHMEKYRPCGEKRDVDSHGKSLSSYVVGEEPTLSTENNNWKDDEVNRLSAVKSKEMDINNAISVSQKEKDGFAMDIRFVNRKILSALLPVIMKNHKEVTRFKHLDRRKASQERNFQPVVNMKGGSELKEHRNVSGVSNWSRVGRDIMPLQQTMVSTGLENKPVGHQDFKAAGQRGRFVSSSRRNEKDFHKDQTKDLSHSEDSLSKDLKDEISDIFDKTQRNVYNTDKQNSTRDTSLGRVKSYGNSTDKLVNKQVNRNNSKQNQTGRVRSFIKDSLHQLIESGIWDLIVNYAKENNLVFTRQTWMYVSWKYIHYHYPTPEKRVEFIYKQNSGKCRLDGNLLLNKDVARSVALKYFKDLRKQLGRDFQLKRVVNVEENHDVYKGDRYLIELDLQIKGQNKTFRLSDYVYMPLGEQSFCSPREFVWQKNTTVHVIVPVKDQGKWVQHFIDDMSELYQQTLDDNFSVIIVDFNSTDIDIEKSLSLSALKSYQLVKVNGSFQRALGIQKGADVVKNPNDILFTCDLHLEIPNNMIEIIRKHCIQGKMAFSPMVMRLDCGFTPSLPYGEWETLGFGLFAIYKSDFDHIGGMNHQEFKTKWGGEDWEMVDRFLQSHMEIERLRVPKFYHFYHSKSGMWGTYGYEDIVSDNDRRLVEDQFVPTYDPENDQYSWYNYNEPLLPEL